MLKLAGKKTDADGTDRVITYSGPIGFTRVVLDCRDTTAEMAFSFDEPLANSNKVVYLQSGDIYDEIVSVGCFSIHYKGSGTFRYQAYSGEVN